MTNNTKHMTTMMHRVGLVTGHTPSVSGSERMLVVETRLPGTDVILLFNPAPVTAEDWQRVEDTVISAVHAVKCR